MGWRAKRRIVNKAGVSSEGVARRLGSGTQARWQCRTMSRLRSKAVWCQSAVRSIKRHTCTLPVRFQIPIQNLKLFIGIFSDNVLIKQDSTFIKTLRPGKNGWCFTDNILKVIFLNENKFYLFIYLFIIHSFFNLHWTLSHRVQLKGMVQVMVWCQRGDKL